ncbi:hypothetical protein [Bradyrhizobium elkanii]|uniref:Uncharacterized protein n=1 Tax=Bradyrhizobium elkanii TaxID=29448 RepID=A0ABV4F0R7_BRAEL|nr:hypothetical protein [Bradyrhizobium elkanii]MCP1758040.1 hypothetical protein [Bradyrhizobium elkanii]MCP1983357.1 hypothetical protein [Bradyrhizobium elkanii]MCS3881663.1 hypothetical protein [Bradyrhizobium elkanii]MCS4218421.1 hypothetical protein [Bradyrhizobium elkanii]MCW2194285.1 hypothetical protein [Bradyrhizobium elkanii]
MQTLIERPADSAGSILSGLAVQQRERETTLLRLRRLRKEASAEIERLIAFLDASDEYVMTERELDDSDREDCFEDDEPDLGSLDRATQTHWSAGGSDDLEDDNDSGIGDMEGLLEQAGTQDWQQGAMA